MVSCPAAVDRLARSLENLVYVDESGECTAVPLTQFRHDSPGLRELRRKIAVALVSLLENDPAAMTELHKLHLKQRRRK